MTLSNARYTALVENAQQCEPQKRCSIKKMRESFSLSSGRNNFFGNTPPSRKAAKVPLWIIALIAIIGLTMACGGGGGPGTDPSHNHSWGDWTDTADATCTEPAKQTRTCADDPTHTETRNKEGSTALGHQWGTEETKKPTTAESGIETITCQRAGCTVTSGTFNTILVGGVVWAGVNLNGNKNFAERPDMATTFWQWNNATAHPATGTVTPWPAINTSSAWSSANRNLILPDGWRLPSLAELADLNTSGSTWAAADPGNIAKGNAIAGRFFGPNHANPDINMSNMGNAIFLPANGFRQATNGVIDRAGERAAYTSSTESPTSQVHHLFFNDDSSHMSTNGDKRLGYSIRLVRGAIP